MSHGHFGTSIALISLLSTELWASKVGTAKFSISRKFFEGQNLENFNVLKDYLDSCCEAPWHFFHYFSSQSKCLNLFRVERLDNIYTRDIKKSNCLKEII